MKPLSWGDGYERRRAHLRKKPDADGPSRRVSKKAPQQALANPCGAAGAKPVTLPHLSFLDPENALPFERGARSDD